MWIFEKVVSENISAEQAGQIFPELSDANCHRRPQQGKF